MASRELPLKVSVTAGLILLDAVWILLGGYHFAMDGLAAAVAATGAMAMIGYYYSHRGNDERLATMGSETALLISFSGAASIYSYLLTSLDMPMIDKALVRADAFFGFNWMDYVAFANAHHWIGVLSSAVYQTILFQVALAVVLLPALGMVDRVRELMALVMISALLCITIAGLIPAEGAIAYYHPAASFLAPNDPVVNLAYKAPFFELRAGTLHTLGLTDVHGLVSFPSYHVALAVIMMLTFRGVRRMFWPVALLNVLVILSTPIDGGHHMIDAVGGAALALGVAAAVVPLRRRYATAAPVPTESDEALEPAWASQSA